MEPVSPVLGAEFQEFERLYAKDQPEYKPLPVIRNAKGVLLSRWKLTDQEREAVAAGADIFLSNWTFNQPLQPVRIEIGECDRDIEAMARFMGLIPAQERHTFGVDFVLADGDMELPVPQFWNRYIEPAICVIRNKMLEEVKRFDVIDMELPKGVERSEPLAIPDVGNGRLIIAWHPGSVDDDGNVLAEAGMRGRIDVLYSIPK